MSTSQPQHDICLSILSYLQLALVFDFEISLSEIGMRYNNNNKNSFHELVSLVGMHIMCILEHKTGCTFTKCGGFVVFFGVSG